MRNLILSSQLAEIEPQAKDLGLWPGTQGPEIEILLPGDTEPILSPGGWIPLGTKITIRAAPGEDIRYFALDVRSEFLSDPKDFGSSEAVGEVTMNVDDPTFFDFSIKARILDGVVYSGLTEIWFQVE